MSQHPNARLTPRGRRLLCERVGGGMRVADAARMAGVSRQTAHKWLARARRGEPMADRGCRPRRLARLTPPEAEGRVVRARSELMLAPLALAAETGVPARTCARIVARRGLPRLADVDRVTGEQRRRGPVTPVRYERERPGELVHVDVKRVARIPDGGGWRARGRGAPTPHGAGRSRLHVAVDDHGRVAYAELLPDEGKGTARGLTARAPEFFSALGVAVERVMTDNGPACRSREFNGLLASRGGQAQVHQALQPLAERQGRAHEQDARAGVAVRPRLGERGVQGRGPGPLHRALQLGPPAQRVRGPAPDVTHRRCKQRLGTQQLGHRGGSRRARHHP